MAASPVPAPPRLARALLHLLAHPDDREFIVGDLEEEYATAVLPALGPRRAARWYWRLAVKSVLARPRPLLPRRRPHTNREPRAGLMDSLRQDLRLAFRSLARRPGFTLAVVLTLALAVGANTAMFSVVNAVLLRPLPYPGADRLVALFQATRERPDFRGWASHLALRDWQGQSRTVEAMAGFSPADVAVTDPGEVDLVDGARVTEGFLAVFGVAPHLGRDLVRAETHPSGPRVAVVGYRLWRERLGGDPGVVGRTLGIDGVAYQVVGVAPEGFDYPSGAQLWLPLQNDDATCGRLCVSMMVVGRLAPGATPDAARRELDAVVRGVEAREPALAGTRMNVVTLEEVEVGAVRTGLLVLLGAVGMVLLIACANVANLLFASAAGRAGEVAVRTALGATRLRLVRQLLTESALLSLLGGAAGLLLAALLLRGVPALAGGALPRLEGLAIDRPVLLFALVLMVDATLLFGLAPAFSIARAPLAALVGTGARASTASPRVRVTRAALILGQVALTVVLVLGAGLLLRSLAELRDVRLGFDPRGVETFSLRLPDARYPDPEERIRFYARLEEQLAAHPAVGAVGGALGRPLSDAGMFTSVSVAGRPDPAPGEGEAVPVRVVTPGYFRALRIPLLRGRELTPRDGAGAPGVVVVSRAAARAWWPDGDAVGRTLEVHASAGLPEAPRTVVGVVDDVRSRALDAPPIPEVYVPHAQSGSRTVSFVVRPRTPGASALPAAREVVRAMDPQLPLIRPGLLRDAVAGELSRPRLYLGLLGAFAGLALVLAVVGIYGVVAYQVALRRREIGIRMALGANVRQVVRLLAWQGMVPALLGLAAGLLLAAAATRVLASLLYNVAPLDAATWVAVPLLLLGVVLLACVVPAGRASRVPAAEALRSD